MGFAVVLEEAKPERREQTWYLVSLHVSRGGVYRGECIVVSPLSSTTPSSYRVRWKATPTPRYYGW